jgi:biopolymer transport protein ExbD
LVNDHGYALDGIPRSAEELRASLSEAARSQGPVEVLLRAPPATPFDKVQGAVRMIRGAGISSIRLAVADSRSEGPPPAGPEKK